MLLKFIRSGRVGSGHRNLTRVQLWAVIMIPQKVMLMEVSRCALIATEIVITYFSFVRQCHSVTPAIIGTTITTHPAEHGLHGARKSITVTVHVKLSYRIVSYRIVATENAEKLICNEIGLPAYIVICTLRAIELAVTN